MLRPPWVRNVGISGNRLSPRRMGAGVGARIAPIASNVGRNVASPIIEPRISQTTTPTFRPQIPTSTFRPQTTTPTFKPQETTPIFRPQTPTPTRPPFEQQTVAPIESQIKPQTPTPIAPRVSLEEQIAAPTTPQVRIEPQAPQNIPDVLVLPPIEGAFLGGRVAVGISSPGSRFKRLAPYSLKNVISRPAVFDYMIKTYGNQTVRLILLKAGLDPEDYFGAEGE